MINFLSIQKVFSVKHNHSHCRWQSIIWPNSALQFASTISVGNSHAWQNYSHSQSKLVRISVKHCYEALESDSSNSPKTGNNIKCEIHENQERLHICYKVKLPIDTSFFSFVFIFFPRCSSTLCCRHTEQQVLFQISRSVSPFTIQGQEFPINK